MLSFHLSFPFCLLLKLNRLFPYEIVILFVLHISCCYPIHILCKLFCCASHTRQTHTHQILHRICDNLPFQPIRCLRLLKREPCLGDSCFVPLPCLLTPLFLVFLLWCKLLGKG